jgi:hypothetical protein
LNFAVGGVTCSACESGDTSALNRPGFAGGCFV